MTTLGNVAKKERIVDIHCARGHLIAILVRNAGLDPWVLVSQRHRDQPPTVGPMLVLSRDGLSAAMTGEEEGSAKIWSLGTPRDMFPVLCPTCVRDFPLVAADLHEKRASWKPGRTIPRLVLRVGVVD